MALPPPEPGLVIPFLYLWRHERNAGRDEGQKLRPAVIVLAVRQSGVSLPRVTVAPITHSPPKGDVEAIELPTPVKRLLGLDDARSWVVIGEVNQFDWPGFDIRTVPGKPGRFAYGFMPSTLVMRIAARNAALARLGNLSTVVRD